MIDIVHSEGVSWNLVRDTFFVSMPHKILINKNFHERVMFITWVVNSLGIKKINIGLY